MHRVSEACTSSLSPAEQRREDQPLGSQSGLRVQKTEQRGQNTWHVSGGNSPSLPRARSQLRGRARQGN